MGGDPGQADEALRQHRQAVEDIPGEQLVAPDPAPPGAFVLYVGPALLGLCVVAFAVISPGLAFVALICLLLLAPGVVLHELAHLVAAKRAGMQVQEFSIGFGQRVWSRRWRGVRWSLKVLPLGGSVEIAGMTVEDVERTQVDPRRAFIYASPLSRLRVVLAGILANVVLAWAALTVAVLALGDGEQTLRSYVVAPVRALLMIGVLLEAGVQALGRVFLDWDSEVGSVLSLPQGFAQGAAESTNQGYPMAVFLLLFFAALNLSLALFNALPLYPLDGYHGATALVDGARRLTARARRSPFAPLSTWRLRWLSRGTGMVLALFVGTVLVRDIVRMM